MGEPFLTYKASGVDVEANNEANERIKAEVRRTHDERVLTRPGLFGGAMSLGYCLVLTGAADWLAINTASALQNAPALIFILGIAFFVLIMTNLIMNVAAIAICLPVALKMAPYLGVGGEVIFFSALVTAGMPFLLLVGAAPNAIAYESKQFSSGEFFRAGVPASLILMAVVAVFVLFIWPLMGMEVLVAKP
jgi:sodium-dependent dicarboxylate transporter 2/3/5